MSSETPDVLTLDPAGDGRYRVRQPEEPPEGRDVVFSGLLQGQMLMASYQACGGTKDVRSIHTIFARAGSYSRPLDLALEAMQAGRTWGSDTVTAWQDERLLARSLVLLHVREPDLIAHGPQMPPDVPSPDGLADGPGQVFPGASWRPVPGAEGSSLELAWHRGPFALASTAANQAVLGWATCGHIIGLAVRPHPDRVRIEDAHRSLATGVIAHTIHFLRPFDVSEWHLVLTEGSAAGGGRIYGRGWVFASDGAAVAAFEQDAMAKAAA